MRARWLGRHPHFWCADASHDLNMRHEPVPKDHEIEWPGGLAPGARRLRLGDPAYAPQA